MKKTNIDGSIVELEVKKRRRKTIVKKIVKTDVGRRISYVGRVDHIKGRIVSFEGTILEDLGETVKCEMIDNYIHVGNESFEIILPKRKIKFTK